MPSVQPFKDRWKKASSAAPQVTDRFSHVAPHYSRYRPDYPSKLFDFVEEWANLHKTETIADIGSGTGLSSIEWLKRGYSVVGVEPNKAMRAEAEKLLAADPRFTSMAGTAEATMLPTGSVDLICSGQAFHWFNIPHAKTEFKRITRSEGRVALFWNIRDSEASPFMAAYERILCEYAPEYPTIRDTFLDETRLKALFGLNGYITKEFEHSDMLSLNEVEGRAQSNSYWPKSWEASYETIHRALVDEFNRHQIRGMVEFVFSARLFVGRVR